MPGPKFTSLPGMNPQYDTRPSGMESAFGALSQAAAAFAQQKQTQQQQEATMLANAFPAMISQGMIGPGMMPGQPGFQTAAPGTYPGPQGDLLKAQTAKTKAETKQLTEPSWKDKIDVLVSAMQTSPEFLQGKMGISGLLQNINVAFSSPEEKAKMLEEAVKKTAKQTATQHKGDVYWIPSEQRRYVAANDKELTEMKANYPDAKLMAKYVKPQSQRPVEGPKVPFARELGSSLNTMSQWPGQMYQGAQNFFEQGVPGWIDQFKQGLDR